MAGRAEMSRFHFILKRCPSSCALCRKKTCVEASDALLETSSAAKQCHAVPNIA